MIPSGTGRLAEVSGQVARGYFYLAVKSGAAVLGKVLQSSAGSQTGVFSVIHRVTQTPKLLGKFGFLAQSV